MARKLTDEEKALRAAERAAKKQQEQEDAAAKKDAEIEALKEELARLKVEAEAKEKDTVETMKAQLATMQEQLSAAQRPQIVTVSADAPKVQFLWQAEVADDNVTTFGDGGMYGRVVGKTGTIYVPKDQLSRLLTSANRYYLDERWLIAVSGLDDEEREALGVNYREGELLDRMAFARMVDLEDGILDIYPNLCDSHKEMVAKRYNEAYADGNPHVRRDVVEALYKMAKAAGRGGDFKEIIERMNAAVTAE